MRRREIIAAFAWVVMVAPAPAQERRRITILHSGFPDRTGTHFLCEELASLRYENGRMVAIEPLGAEGDPDRLERLVAHQLFAR